MTPAEAYLARLCPRSRVTYSSDLRALERLTGGQPWQDVDGVALVARLVEVCAPGTARRRICALKGVLRECWRQGLLTAEQLQRATDLPPVRGERERAGRALSLAELERLLSNAASDRDRALLAVTAGAGLRRAEAAALLARDVSRRAGRVELLVNGKGRRQRRVALPDWAAAALRTYVRSDPRLDAEGLTHLFGVANGCSVNDAVHRAADRAGLGPVTAHDLRRTYASLALSRGMSVATLRRSMGHSSVKTTLIYDRRPDDEVVAEAARLDTGPGPR